MPLALALVLGTSLGWKPLRAGECPPLVLGVLPYVSASNMVAHQAPVLRHLEAELGVPVRIRTARDFTAFEQQVAQGRWDLVMANPVQARRWLAGGRWTPIAETRRRIRALLVARAGEEPGELRGRRLAAADPKALLYALAREVLERRGVAPERDLELLWTGTHDNAMLAVLYGAADVAVTGERLFRSLAPERRQRLRVLERSREAPGLVVLAARRLRDACVEAIRSALGRFPSRARAPAPPGGGGRSAATEARPALPYLLEGFRVLQSRRGGKPTGPDERPMRAPPGTDAAPRPDSPCAADVAGERTRNPSRPPWPTFQRTVQPA